MGGGGGGNAPTTNTHHMVTRAKAGISKPLARMNCHATTTSPIPRSHLHALRDPNWHKAMVDEYNALISNGTWALVPRQLMYKARLVANGRSQQQGIDCDETFSLVVKPATIHTVLSLAVTRDWPIHQLDVKNAYLHGQLSETVYMHQPPGFVIRSTPHSKTDTSLFVYHMGSDVAYLLLYVDDIILTASSTALLQRIITLLHSEFAMTDLGSLNYFLGVSASDQMSGMFLSQSKFVEEILERAHMQHCNPCKTPVDTESKLGSDGDPVSDPTLYRSLAGALQYLTFTRPDISYAVQQICLYMHDPRDPHFTALKHADWAGCPVTRRSTSGYCVFLGDNLLSWSAKRQVTLSRSSAEAEYRGVANVVAETAWIRNLLLELHTPLFTATLVPSRYTAFQYADIFTKGLPTTLFLEFRSILNVRSRGSDFDIPVVFSLIIALLRNKMVTTRRNSDDDVPNFEAMITAAVANALPNLTAALRTQITNDIRNGAGPSGGGGGDAIPQGIHVWIERFTKLKPLAFRSAATPAEAEDWITHISFQPQ
ncbi:ribonuclease H-like domain-containing protein [Tanacetum coccineum]